MANFICSLAGVRGRTINIYDNKCEIITNVTIGSVLTNNATDGRKTIFYKDCVGVQLKEAGIVIGYLQLETPSLQMNNQKDNFFSENTFTFSEGINNITNALMRDIYKYITDRIEGYKYQDNDLLEADFPASLANLYGRSRPLLKSEIEQARKEQEEKKARELREKEEKRALEIREKEERLSSIAEKNKSGNIDKRLLVFFASIEGTNRYNSIAKEWNAQGLSGDPLYSDLEIEIMKRAQVERMFGGTLDKEITAFIAKWKEQLKINL